MKKYPIYFMGLRIYFALLLFCLGSCTNETAGNETNKNINNEDTDKNIVSVIDYGIKNDGSPIGSELNALVRKSYKKTLFFPAGTYTLTEPIVLPLDYDKNVNIIFDKNALVKSDVHLEALIKVGYSEMNYITDNSNRRFSYIEGGILDCYNADNGILINGLKQMVQIRTMSLVRGRNTHIRINVTDLTKNSSCDTKIDNVTIHGMSSNEEIYGIYIDRNCNDAKISNTFIYSTKHAIVTKSAGHILNNIHILSWLTTGGKDLGGNNNYRETEGIRIEASGFFVFNQIYFDTVDKCIVIADNNVPTIMMDQSIFYSYLNNFGSSFIYSSDKNSTSYFKIKVSNSTLVIRNKGYKIFDFKAPLVGWDVDEKYSFINCAIDNSNLEDPYDPALLQRVRKVSSDALIYTGITYFDTDWHILGALITSPYRSLLHIDFSDNFQVDLNLKFSGSLNVFDYKISNTDNQKFQIGYIIKGDFCVLLFKPKQEGNFYPIISDLSGNGSFMPTPSKDKHYRLSDYGIENSTPKIIIDN
ncbi:MAG: hypothetical protein LKE68_02615 [Prevotella sp.]|jgi:hypothetical protein|nr:hypothetical protein [Prevotella sp.]MCH3991515.1 hypothetical protein [Prevotella sp.]